MSRRRPRLFEQIPNRGLTNVETATYLGLSEGRFTTLLPKLQKAGFPKPDDLLERYDREAIDCWLDRRAGLAESSGEIDEWELDKLIDGYGNGRSQGEAPAD